MAIETSKERVGIIGVGRMGLAMAKHLVRHGYAIAAQDPEIFELVNPHFLHRFEYLTDSAGAGQWRGGLALRREYELLEDATVIRRFDKTRFPPQGVAGGKPGGRARFVVRLGNPDEHETRASARYEMKAGERFLLQSAAGGGFGDPRTRERAAIACDLAEGYVTEQAAREVYRDGD